MRRVVSWLPLLLSLLPAARLADAAPQPDRLEQGRAIYNARCYFCHGYAGDAATTASQYLTPRPRSFTDLPVSQADRARLRAAVTNGRPGTAMQSFSAVLDGAQIEAVVEFILAEFVVGKRRPTRYHLDSAGWSQAMLTEARSGKQFSSDRHRVCLTCHEAARPPDGEPALDVVSGASPYAVHDRAPALASPDARLRTGERLFQQNCSFCHARDGSGRNWIGSFMEPHARDLRSPQVCNVATLERLPRIIAEGLPDTSMPAWRHVLEPAQIDAVAAYIRRAFCSR